MRIRWLLLLSFIQLSASSLFQEKLPFEIYGAIASYLSKPSELKALRQTCHTALENLNLWLQVELLEILPESSLLLPKHRLAYFSLHFRFDLISIKALDFPASIRLNQIELVLLLLWYRIQLSPYYLPIPCFYKLRQFLPRALEGSWQTLPGAVFESDKVLELQLLSDATERHATRIVHFMCSRSRERLIDALFKNLLVHVKYEAAVNLFSDSIALLLPHIKQNLNWFSLCIDRGNLALFDAFVRGFEIEEEMRAEVAQLYNQALFEICQKQYVVSRVLLTRPEISDFYMSEALRLCIESGNWRMATELLRFRHPTSMEPTLAWSTVRALKFLIFQVDDSFTEEAFHESFGDHPELLQVVAELGFPDFFVLNRVEILFASGKYEIQNNGKISLKYRKFTRTKSLCVIN